MECLSANKKLRIMNYELRIKRKDILCLNEINRRHIMICKKSTTINNFKTWNVYQLIKNYELRIMNYDWLMANG